MKFASFETIVEMIYNYLPGQKSDYNKGAQTAVAFTGGYAAGILCAIVSHPADVMVGVSPRSLLEQVAILMHNRSLNSMPIVNPEKPSEVQWAVSIRKLASAVCGMACLSELS